MLTSFTFQKKNKKELKTMEYNYSLIEGIKHKYIGNLKSSLALFKNSLDISDSSAAAHFEIANIYLMMDMPKEALPYSQRATLLDPDNIWYKFQYGHILIALKNYNEATEVFNSIINLSPDNINVRYELALIYLKNNDNHNAMRIYNDIEKKFGIREANSIYKYSLFLENGEYERARKEINILIENYPTNYSYYNYLANINLHQEDTAKAIKNFKYVLSKEDDNPVAISSLIELYYLTNSNDEIINLLDNFFNNQQILDNAKINFYVNFSQEIENYKTNFKTIKQILHDFSILSKTIQSKSIYTDFLIRAQYYDEAINELKNLIELNKFNPLYYDQLINLYSVKRESDSIIAYSNKAISLFKNNSNFYLYAGLGYLQKSNFIKSKELFESGVSLLNSDNEFLRFDFYTYLGDVCYRLNDYSCSDDYFNKALKIDSTNNLVLNNYAYYLALREENLDKAEQMSRKTVNSDSLSSTYLDTYAWILYKLEKFDKAKLYIEKAYLYGGKSNSEILEHYGDILFKLKMIEDAKYFWNQSIKNGGDSTVIRKKIFNINIPVNSP